MIANRAREEGPLRGFVEEVRAIEPPVHRAPGAAVFLHSDPDTTPLALRQNVEHNHVLHRRVFIVSIKSVNVPRVDPAHRLVIDDLGYRDDGLTLITAHFGYREPQDLPGTLDLVVEEGGERATDVERASYFVSRITVVVADAPGMRRWRRSLFIFMWRNQADAVMRVLTSAQTAVHFVTLLEDKSVDTQGVGIGRRAAYLQLNHMRHALSIRHDLARERCANP